MNFSGKKTLKRGIIITSAAFFMILLFAGVLIIRTWGKTVIQVDIRQNMDIIHLSTFGEPPQFAVWLEEPETGELKTIFVTHRVAEDDWEGKAAVPVALPQWTKLFRDGDSSGTGRRSDLVVTGATPKEDYFSIRAEVPPGSEWIFWIEMNLAGDFNEAFPEFDFERFFEDEYSRGQPSLLYRAEIKAIEDMVFTPVLEAQSTLENGIVRIEPVSDGVTTARNVFDTIQVSIIRPKPKLIEKNRLDNF
jgi:hypothetical protein